MSAPTGVKSKEMGQSNCEMDPKRDEDGQGEQMSTFFGLEFHFSDGRKKRCKHSGFEFFISMERKLHIVKRKEEKHDGWVGFSYII